jgi:hypothetical protein
MLESPKRHFQKSSQPRLARTGNARATSFKAAIPGRECRTMQRVPILGGTGLKNGRQSVHNVHKNSTKFSSPNVRFVPPFALLRNDG